MKLYYKDIIGFSCLILITLAGALFLFDSQLKIAAISENHDYMDETKQKLIERYVTDSTFVVFGMIIFMICVIVMITTFSRNPMLTNIKNIKNATRKISEGDFNIRTSIVGSKDEMFYLAKDIDLMAKKLLEQQQELIKTERLSVVGELSAILAHDIRNPLNVIKQSVELIQLKTNQEKTQRDFQRIDKSIKRIVHQVDQVLNYVKTPPLQIEYTTVLTILKQSLDLLTIPDNISIEIPEKDFEVKWDETQISVVFTNVILNAIQAIGNDDGNIYIRISEANETVIIVMEDTGPDIPEKDLEKIFELLYSTKMEGTGLGLSSCKNIVQQHNGTISAHNNPTTFTITLPKIIPAKQEARVNVNQTDSRYEGTPQIGG